MPAPPSAGVTLSDANARLVAARRLTGRRARREAGLFLAEGVQSVREALASPGVVSQLFVTAEAYQRHHQLLAGSALDVDLISDKAATALSETVSPQGLVAVCRIGAAGPLIDLLRSAPRLVVVAVEPGDPGNLGTIIRTADAAGADAVIVDGGADPYGGKAVRASAGSIFHLPVLAGSAIEVIAQLEAAGVQTLATSGAGDSDLDDLDTAGELTQATAWVFGNEARGLPDEVLALARRSVRIPLYGRAESLNLSKAAAVCLYTSARAQRRATGEPIGRSPDSAR